MLLTKREGPEHLQHWSCARLGVISRHVLGGAVSKCEISGLSYARQGDSYVIPVPDTDAGQGLHFEIRRPGVLAEINGKELTWTNSGSLLFGDTTIYSPYNTTSTNRPTPIVRLFPNRGSVVHWDGVGHHTNTFQLSADWGIFPITSMSVKDNVHLIEIQDRDEDLDVSYIVPLRDTCVVSKFEEERLLYASGAKPTVGIFGDIEVLVAPSAFMVVDCTLTKDLRTLRFMHIVGMSDIGFESSGAVGSYEQVTLLFVGSQALVFFGSSRKAAGKFKYEVGSKLNLQNVFNLKFFEGDVIMSHGFRYYKNTDKVDVGLDVIMYKTDRRFDFASGVDSKGSQSILDVGNGHNELIQLPEPVEGCKVYGVEIQSSVSGGSVNRAVYGFNTEKGEYKIHLNPSGIQVYLGNTTLFDRLDYRGGNHTLLFSGSNFYIIGGRKLAVYENVGVLQQAPKILSAPNEYDASLRTLDRIVVFVSKDYVLPDGAIFADARSGRGYVGEYQRGSRPGVARVNLPADSYQTENPGKLEETSVGAKFEGYVLECNGGDASPVVRSEVTSKFEGYVLECNGGDASPVVRSEVTSKFEGYVLEVRPGDAPELQTHELEVFGIFTNIAVDHDDDPDVTFDFSVPELEVFGIFTNIAEIQL